MSAQQRADRMRLGEGGETVRARAIGVELVERHVEPARIEHVAREHQSRLRIIDHDVRGLVAGRRNDVEQTFAEIIVADLARPVADVEKPRDRLRLEPDDLGVGPAAEFVVPAMVIAMAMRMRDDQMDRPVTMPGTSARAQSAITRSIGGLI